MTAKDLDRLIDAAARELTGATAPLDLRARVIAEISHEDEAKASFHRGAPGGWRRGIRVRRQLAWLAAAAGLILAAYLAWPDRRPTQAPAVTVATTRPIETSTPPTAAAPQPAGVTRAANDAGRDARAAEAGPAETVAAIPALAEPAAIDIPRIDADATEIAQLESIAPLDTAPLEIKPLTPFE